MSWYIDLIIYQSIFQGWPLALAGAQSTSKVCFYKYFLKEWLQSERGRPPPVKRVRRCRFDCRLALIWCYKRQRLEKGASQPRCVRLWKLPEWMPRCKKVATFCRAHSLGPPSCVWPSNWPKNCNKSELHQNTAEQVWGGGTRWLWMRAESQAFWGCRPLISQWLRSPTTIPVVPPQGHRSLGLAPYDASLSPNRTSECRVESSRGSRCQNGANYWGIFEVIT